MLIVNLCNCCVLYYFSWAAGVIAISWIMHVRMSRMKRQLKTIRKMHADNFRVRAKVINQYLFMVINILTVKFN